MSNLLDRFDPMPDDDYDWQPCRLSIRGEAKTGSDRYVVRLGIAFIVGLLTVAAWLQWRG